jgi:hypothetical protein
MRGRFWLAVSLMVVGMVWLAAKPVLAAEYFVALTGSNSNSGGMGSPWLTIKYGIEHLHAGDTLNIMPGTYVLALSKVYEYAYTKSSGTASAPITVRPYNHGEVVIDGNSVVGAFLIVNHNYWQIEELEIKRVKHGIHIWGGDHNVVRDLIIHDIFLDSVLFPNKGTVTGLEISNEVNEVATCDDNLLENNRIFNLPEGEAIYVGKAGAGYLFKCRNNRIIDNALYAVWEGIDSKINAENNYFQGNVIYNCGHFGIGSPNGNIILGNKIYNCGRYDPKAAIMFNRNSQVYNNLIYNNPGYGIRVNGWVVDGEPMGFGNEIYHNTIVNNNVGIYLNTSENLHDNVFKNNISAFNQVAKQKDNSSLGDNNVFDYNDWYGGSGTSDVFDGPNTLHVDPGFVDRAGNDFRLLEDSGVKDKGTVIQNTTADVNKDFMGNSRVNQPDMGAYEYVSEGPSPTPPVVEGTLEFEAEDMGLTSPMVVVDDSLASGGKFIQSGTSAAGVASYVFQVPDGEGGDYRIEGRVIADTGGNDSFFVSMDQPSTAEINTWDIYYEIPEAQRSNRRGDLSRKWNI